MIAPSFHPVPVRATCEPRSRWSFGLTPRSIALLIAGFAFLIPGFWDSRLSYAMLAWDALVLLAALLDGMRLPRADKLTATRSWSNAPSLDSQTEIELTIENNGSVIIECRLIDDLPPALRDASAQQEPIHVTAFPRVPANGSLSRGTAGARRLHHGPALRSLSFAALRLAERWARRRWPRRCASIRRCAPAKSSRYSWRAAGRSTCNCGKRGSAASGATSKACATTAKATTCATSAGPQARVAET